MKIQCTDKGQVFHFLINFILNKVWVSKHANLVYECITSYIYAYQRRCPKQDVLRTLMNAFYTYATKAGIHPCMHCF